MAFCSSCGSQPSDAARFCSTCGAAMPVADTVEPPKQFPAAPEPATPASGSSNTGCGRTAAIGCGVTVGAVVLLIVIFGIIGAIVESNSSTTATSAAKKSTSEGARSERRAVSAPVRPPKPHVLLDVEGTGIKTTQRFEAPDEWAVVYSFDCSNFGQSGNFSIAIQGDAYDLAANQLSMRGHDISYEHSGGNVYLEINSECNWRVQALAQ